MKFVPTLNLWDRAISTLIRDGRMKLQVGQWVRCGSEKRSRIVCITEHGTIWAIHPNEEKKGRQSYQYNRWLEIVRDRQSIEQRDRRAKRNWAKEHNHA